MLDDAVEIVGQVCDRCTEGMTLSAATVSLMMSDNVGHLVASAGRHGDAVSRMQLTTGEGPDVDAYRHRCVVAVPDLLTNGLARWPAFARAALDIGVRSVMSVPLDVEGAIIGTLCLASDEPGGLAEDERDDAVIFASVATKAILLLLSCQAGMNLLAGSSVDPLEVNQATGMVAEQLKLSMADALARLRGHAVATGRSLHTVAHDVVAGLERLDP